MSVDFPAPEGPKTAKIPPGPAIPETSPKIRFWLFLPLCLTVASTKRCRHERVIITFFPSEDLRCDVEGVNDEDVFL